MALFKFVYVSKSGGATTINTEKATVEQAVRQAAREFRGSGGLDSVEVHPPEGKAIYQVGEGIDGLAVTRLVGKRKPPQRMGKLERIINSEAA